MGQLNPPSADEGGLFEEANGGVFSYQSARFVHNFFIGQDLPGQDQGPRLLPARDEPPFYHQEVDSLSHPLFLA